MPMVRSNIIYVFLLLLITFQCDTFINGRILRSIDQVNRNKQETGTQQDINSKPVDGGKYHPDSEKKGHSPGVGHPLEPSPDATKPKVEPSLEDKTHDHSPGAGHSIPTSADYTRSSEAAENISTILEKHYNAGRKPSDYSPGVGHSFLRHDKEKVRPESTENNSHAEKHYIQDKAQGHSPDVSHLTQDSDEHTTTKVLHNNDEVQDKPFSEELIRIESHSPGVGHSIQQKHTKPRAKK